MACDLVTCDRVTFIMKIPLKWLKDHVALSVSAEQLAHRLTMAGLEVEKITDRDGDKVFELEITPNRPDCLNVAGIAREAAAIFNKNLKDPKIKKMSLPKNKTDITIQERKLCSRYIGIVLRGVKVGPSPNWLKERLEAIGLRSINNVVDITNFCLMELGQPLHAFDYDKLSGGKIVVRRAKPGESITTIDGAQYKLDTSILVIADERHPVAVAGIMGGKETEVTAATQNILLESAYFDPLVIRLAGRKLGLASDSSYRFERGVAIDMVSGGARRAISLIQEVAGGTPTAFADIFPGKKRNIKKRIKISVPEINALLGGDLTASRIQGILKKLGFTTSLLKNVLQVTPPLFRSDIHAGVDVIEEVARIIGYDALPSTTPHIKMSLIKPHHGWLCKNHLRTLLTAQGLNEIITYSMTNRKDLEKTNLGDWPGIKINNPLNQDQEMLRPSLLPNFLSVLSFNISRGQKDIRIFELGKIYASVPEKEALGILLMGTRQEDWRQMNKASVDFYDLKGCVDVIFNEYAPAPVIFENVSHAAFENQQAVAVKVANQQVGVLGKVARDVLERWDIKRAQVFFVELDIAWLYDRVGMERRYQPVFEFPAVVRDISLAVKKEVTFAKIKEVVLPFSKELLRSMKFIEEYSGEKIPAGHRGVIFSLTYQSPIRTLTEEEVNTIHERLCQSLVDQLGAIRR